MTRFALVGDGGVVLHVLVAESAAALQHPVWQQTFPGAVAVALSEDTPCGPGWLVEGEAFAEPTT